MSKGTDIGTAVIALVGRTIQASTKDFGPSISEATAAFSHVEGTKDELREALAYVACQVHAYQRIANQDAALAVQQIETIVHEYRARRPVEATHSDQTTEP